MIEITNNNFTYFLYVFKSENHLIRNYCYVIYMNEKTASIKSYLA